MSEELKFDEKKHEYTVDKKKYTSVTQLIGKYKNPFEADKMSELVATNCNKGLKQLIKLGFVVPTEEFAPRLEKQNPVNKTMIKKIWKENGDEASQHGTEVHNLLEHYVEQGETLGWLALLKFEKSKAKVDFGVEFIDSLEAVKLLPELKIFNEEYLVAGTGDLLVQKENGHYDLIDYKTNKKIESSSFGDKKMLAPLDHIPDCNFWHYALQQTMYKIMMQIDMDIEIDNIALLHLRDDGCELITVPFLEKEVMSIMELNK